MPPTIPLNEIENEKPMTRSEIVKGYHSHLVPDRARFLFDGKRVQILLAQSTPDGLCVTRHHKLDAPLLMAEIGETRQVEVFMPSRYHIYHLQALKGERKDCLERPEHAGMIFTMKVGDPLCLPIDTRAVALPEAPTGDRLLFRKVQLVSRVLTGPDAPW